MHEKLARLMGIRVYYYLDTNKAALTLVSRLVSQEFFKNKPVMKTSPF